MITFLFLRLFIFSGTNKGSALFVYWVYKSWNFVSIVSFNIFGALLILKIKKKNQNWYSNPYSKIKFFFIILNYLFGNLQEICKILKLKTQILKKLKTQTQTQTFEYFWVHMYDFCTKIWLNSLLWMKGIKVATLYYIVGIKVATLNEGYQYNIIWIYLINACVYAWCLLTFLWVVRASLTW